MTLTTTKQHQDRHEHRGPLLGNMTGAEQYRAIQAITAHRRSRITAHRDVTVAVRPVPMQMNLKDPAARTVKRSFVSLIGNLALICVCLLATAVVVRMLVSA